MRLYLAGWQASRRKRELEVIKRGNLKYRCFSFANLVKLPGFPYYIKGFEGSYQACIENKIGIMMDSGVFSYRNYTAYLKKNGNEKGLAKLLDIDSYVQQYVAYCKGNHKKWDWYATVDMTRDVSVNYPMHVRLLEMGIKPVPVYHGDKDLDWIRKYHDLGHKLIAIGGSPVRSTSRNAYAQYLHAVFNLGAKLGVEYHGLAATSPWIVLQYPWFSCDSSWWTRTAGYGSIQSFNPVTCRMSILHVSDTSSKAKGHAFKYNTRAMQALKEEVEAEGFDLDLLRTSFTERHIWNSRAMTLMAETATKRHKSTWNMLF